MEDGRHQGAMWLPIAREAERVHARREVGARTRSATHMQRAWPQGVMPRGDALDRHMHVAR